MAKKEIENAITLINAITDLTSSNGTGIAFIDLNGNLIRSNLIFDSLMAENNFSAFWYELVEFTLNGKKADFEEHMITEKKFFSSKISFNENSEFYIFIFPEAVNSTDIKTKHDRTEIRAFSHDLNNIFNSILNISEMLLADELVIKERLRFVGLIKDASLRGVEINNLILRQKKDESQDIGSIHFRHIIEKIISHIEFNLNKGININFTCPGNQFKILGREIDFYRIIYNLIINAIESIDKTGNIFISIENNIGISTLDNAELKNSHVKLTVKDDGCGIPKEIKAGIINGGISTKIKNYEGGLGLKIVRELVEKYNGTIRLKSELNEGTTFSIYFPTSDLISGTATTGKRSKILIAEDELTVRELLTELFQFHQFEVITVSSADSILKEFEKSPDIAIMLIDKNLRGGDGLEAVLKLREKNYLKPIILASGSAVEEGMSPKEKEIVDLIIKKPYNFEHLLFTINRLL